MQTAKKSQEIDLKNLLIIFNQYDYQNHGFITSDQVNQILKTKFQFSISLHNHLYTFDDLLSIISIHLNPKSPSFYVLSFIKMLSQYQKKCQSIQNFQEAQKTQKRISEIKQRQFTRRKNFIKDKQMNQWQKIQKNHQQQIKNFNQGWQKHMEDFQKSSIAMLQQLKNKHLQQLQKQQKQVKMDISSSSKYSKQIIQLKNKQKTLLKIRNYNEVIKARKILQEVKNRQNRALQQIYESAVQKKLTAIKKQQMTGLQVLKNKIRNERGIILNKKKQERECLVLRIKNIRNELKRRFTEQQRRILENLRQQQMCLSRRKVQNK